MKKVAMMQPTFLPWLGYFELIMKADVFIFSDDFQFVYRSFHRRNRILSNGSEKYLIVPINKKKNDKKPMNQTIITEDASWRKNLWETIENAYHGAEYFSKYALKLKPVFLEKQEVLSAQNIKIIKIICNILGIVDKFVYSSQMSAQGARSLKNQRMLEEVGADVYLCARGSFDYMLEDGVFPLPHIEVRFQNAVPQPYFQYGNQGLFVPYLSVLDALFNVGADVTRELISKMTENWLTWDEMIATAGKVTGAGRREGFTIMR